MIGLIFDLDGTLVDSKKGIIESFNFAFKKIFKKPPEFEISDLIGPPLNEILNKIDNPTKNQERKFLIEFKKHYDNYGYKKSFLYDKVLDELIQLKSKKITLFVATNKRLKPTLLILKKLNLHGFFKEVICSDSFVRKISKTKMLKTIYNKHNHNISKFLMIGDTVHDFIASKNNNIEFIYVEYGYGKIDLSSVNSVKKITEIINYL
ncbi:HAD family hydrolase [Flavobacteriaceae bacterium]|nr:HAD family hydrolase [Flavobacteriaceae bacterium]MDB9901547.1 HAD family hydrolase [Flavobacteriaceae bacterium]